MSTKPSVTTVNPTNPVLNPLIGSQTSFLQGIFNGNNPFAGSTNPLQTQASNAIATFLGQTPSNSSYFGDISGALKGLFGVEMGDIAANYGGFNSALSQPQGNWSAPGFLQTSLPGAFSPGSFGALGGFDPRSFGGPGGFNPQAFSAQNGFSENAFGRAPDANLIARFAQEMQAPEVQAASNPFYGQEVALQGPLGELRNPYGDIGAMNPAFGQLAAMTPIFDRNLSRANSELNNLAPGRFSSAFVQQGQDLASTALQDYNLFAQQALQQGQQLQLQQQQANQNFMLGARGIAQDALSQFNQSRIGARDVAQRGVLESNAQQLQAQSTNAANALQARSLAQQAAGMSGQLGVDAFSATASAQNAARQNQINASLGFAGINADQQSAMNQMLLGARGQDIGLTQAQMQAALGARGQNSDFMSQQMQAALGARGQDVQGLSALWNAQLGASGQGLQAQQFNQQYGLDARQMAQNAFFSGQQNLFNNRSLAQQGILQGANSYGQMGLAQDSFNAQQFQNHFANMLGAGQFGLAQTQQSINPILQLMLGGLDYGKPSPLETVVGPSQAQTWMGGIGQILGGAAQAYGIYNGMQGGGRGSPQGDFRQPTYDPRTGRFV